MREEFYQEPKKKNAGRYALWFFGTIIVALIFIYLFLPGVGEMISRTKIFFASASPEASAEEPLFENMDSEVLGLLNLPEEKNIPGKPWGETLSMFRGNPTRSWYGSGAIPDEGVVVWRYPEKAMCSDSIDKGVTKQWCGNGWTGQPVVYEHDGLTEIIFGAYDKSVHFVNAETGKDARAPFPTGDIIKGSVTLDPDGFPLLYFGSRDNKLRIVSLEGNTTKELWSLDSKDLPGIWNDDWDSNPVVIDDILFTGGENGWFFAIKLNRQMNTDGKISVAPEIIFTVASYDDEFLAKLGDKNASIENSVAIYKDTVYFANSGGRIIGLDIKNVADGIAPTVFDYWAGDDIDASIVIDENGMLYVAVEEERLNARSAEIGQLLKLDPSRVDPLVWSVKIPSKVKGIVGGIWATPALHENFLYVPTNPGELLAVDTATGIVTYRDDISAHAWSSPIISEDELLVTTCDGRLRKYSLADPAKPEFLKEFSIPTKSCIESTPALWKGEIYFGARDGYFYKMR